MTKLFYFSLLLCIISCNESSTEVIAQTPIKYDQNTPRKDSILHKYINLARSESLYSTERQEYIDAGLKEDSTIAYLWQQKSMPLFKMGKYEIGMKALDNAVKYDEPRYLDYRGFMNCIFAKNYTETIKDFELYKAKYGDSYVMDHSYDFYIGLSYLMLNEYEKAEKIFEADAQREFEEKGEDWVHNLIYFYHGISLYSQKKYEEALVPLDKAINSYDNFSDAIYYKSICLEKLNKINEANKLYELALKYGKQGYTISEDNAIYERYPYQIRWNHYSKRH